MEVVGHDAVCEDAHVEQLTCFFKQELEVFVFLVIFEYRRATICAIDNVIDSVANGEAVHSGHADTTP